MSLVYAEQSGTVGTRASATGTIPGSRRRRRHHTKVLYRHLNSAGADHVEKHQSGNRRRNIEHPRIAGCRRGDGAAIVRGGGGGAEGRTARLRFQHRYLEYTHSALAKALVGIDLLGPAQRNRNGSPDLGWPRTVRGNRGRRRDRALRGYD